MKTSIPLVALCCNALIFLNSCAVSNNSVVQYKPDTENARETSSTCYVLNNDGTVQQFSSLKLVTGVLKTPHLIGDNKIIINAKDIKAYQDNKFYAVSPKSLTTAKTAYVATETLPGFAVRIAKGKLNIYCRKYYNGNNTVDEYFLQSGDEGQILSYSPQIMNDMVKDNSKAADYYNSKIKISPKSKKLLVTADIYNNSQMLSKN